MLSALLTALPFILRLANWVMDKVGMSEKEKQETAALILSSKDDATTPIKMKDDFKTLRAKLKLRMDAQKAALK